MSESFVETLLTQLAKITSVKEQREALHRLTDVVLEDETCRRLVSRPASLEVLVALSNAKDVDVNRLASTILCTVADHPSLLAPLPVSHLFHLLRTGLVKVAGPTLDALHAIISAKGVDASAAASQAVCANGVPILLRMAAMQQTLHVAQRATMCLASLTVYGIVREEFCGAPANATHLFRLAAIHDRVVAFYVAMTLANLTDTVDCCEKLNMELLFPILTTLVSHEDKKIVWQGTRALANTICTAVGRLGVRVFESLDSLGRLCHAEDAMVQREAIRTVYHLAEIQLGRKWLGTSSCLSPVVRYIIQAKEAEDRTAAMAIAALRRLLGEDREATLQNMNIENLVHLARSDLVDVVPTAVLAIGARALDDVEERMVFVQSGGLSVMLRLMSQSQHRDVKREAAKLLALVTEDDLFRLDIIEKNGLDILASCCNDSDPALQLASMMCIANLAEDREIAGTMVRFFPCLFSKTHDTMNPPVQAHATRTLANIALGGMGMQKALSDAGATSLLTRLVKEGSPPVKLHAIAALMALCRSATARRAAIQCGLLDELSTLSRDTSNTELKVSAEDALVLLTGEDTTMRTLDLDIGRAVALLDSGVPSVMCHAVRFLSECVEKTHKEGEIAREGGLPALIRLLQSPDLRLKTATAILLAKLSKKQNPLLVAQMVEASIIEALLHLLSSKEHIDILRQAAYMLHNVTLGIERHAERVMKEGGIDLLYPFLQHKDTEVKRYATAALCSLAVNEYFTAKILTKGKVEWFLNLVYSVDTPTQRFASDLILRFAEIPSLHEKLLSKKAIDVIVLLATHVDNQLKGTGLRILGQLSVGSAEQKAQLVRYGGFDSLLLGIKSTEKDTHRLASSALEQLMSPDHTGATVFEKLSNRQVLAIASSPLPQMKEQSLSCLADTASREKDRMEIVRLHGIRVVATLLSDANVLIARQALRLLAELSRDEITAGEISEVCCHEAISAIIQLGSRANDVVCGVASARCLANLAAIGETADRIVFNRGLLLFKGLLACPSDEAQFEAVRALTAIATGNAAHQVDVVLEGLVSSLVWLAEEGSYRVQGEIASCLSALAGNEDVKDRFVKEGGREALDALGHSLHHTVKLKAIRGLYQLYGKDINNLVKKLDLGQLVCLEAGGGGRPNTVPSPQPPQPPPLQPSLSQQQAVASAIFKGGRAKGSKSKMGVSPLLRSHSLRALLQTTDYEIQQRGKAVEELLHRNASDESRAISDFLENFDATDDTKTMAASYRRFVDGMIEKMLATRRTELREIFMESREAVESDKISVVNVISNQIEKAVLLPLCTKILHHIHEEVREDEELYAQNLALVRNKPQLFFGIAPEFISPTNWSLASVELGYLNKCSLPSEMLMAIFTAARSITANTTQASQMTGDDILPIFIYIVAHSEVHRPLVACRYMWEFCDPSSLMGEMAYYLTVFEASFHYIKSLSLEAIAKEDSKAGALFVKRFSRQRLSTELSRMSQHSYMAAESELRWDEIVLGDKEDEE